MSWRMWWSSLIGKLWNWTRSTSTITPPAYLHVEELERRVFMSASPLGVFVPEADLVNNLATQDHDLADPIWAWSPESPDQVDEWNPTHSAGSTQSDATNPSNEWERRVVFVDARVEDQSRLLSGLGLDGADVYSIGAGSNGIDFMSNVLESYAANSVTTVAIVSHSGTGTLLAGNVELTHENFVQYARKFEPWSDALSENADILLLGCELAKYESGRRLVEEIAKSTGADVAASNDVTANSSLGGDWDLEYQTGVIETAFNIDQVRLNEYAHRLITGTSGADFIVGTGASESHSGLAGNDIVVGGVNLATDGQFLNGTVSGSYTTYTDGQSFGGWTVTNGDVDLLNTFGFASPTGGRGVDLDGTTPGAISQNITTVVGNTYEVRFLMSANGSGVATKGLELKVDGASAGFSV
ncbi:MAG: DUF4347 domain-containing protein, partial [Planctomycetaceae bacterium]|nr:DUF4347 domain-containing protein [Planctomycetaceae bacterium]